MVFSFLDKDNLYTAYKESQNYMRPLFDPFDEFERIARNQPHADIAKGLPKVTDGTTSSIIQKTPRRIIQQLPTGVVHSDTEDWLTIMASFILNNEIIPNANMQFALLQKCWHLVKKGLTFGSQPVFVQFVKRGDYFGTDITIPFVKDVLYEPGKLSDADSNYIFLRAWYQPQDIKAIIHKEKQLIKSAKERGEEYKPEWDLKALESIQTDVSQKPDEQQSSSERERQNDGHRGGIEIIHAFQRGIGATFYSFHPKTETCVRTKVNKDPRGELPIHTFYADTDGSNPLGWGLAEQLGPLQNLMDSEMQMYQLNRALMLNPPLIKKGAWSKSQAKFRPNQIIDLGSDPNSSLEALQIDSTAIGNFPQNYGLMKSQMLNLAASPDASISAEVGNPGFSKTDSGVKQQAANVSVDDNYVRKQFETLFERVCETMVNLYFAERSGIEEIQVDKDTARKLAKIDPALVSEDNKVRIDFDDATEALKFEVDASSSNMKNNQEQLDSLDGLLNRYESSQVLQSVIPPKKIISVWNSIVASSGVENPEDLAMSDEEIQEMEAQQAQAEQQQMMQQQAMDQQAMQGQEMQQMPTEQPQPDPAAEESAAIEQELADLDEQEAQIDPEASQFTNALRAMGYDEDRIGQANAMLDADINEEEILATLGAANG